MGNGILRLPVLLAITHLHEPRTGRTIFAPKGSNGCETRRDHVVILTSPAGKPGRRTPLAAHGHARLFGVRTHASVARWHRIRTVAGRLTDPHVTAHKPFGLPDRG